VVGAANQSVTWSVSGAGCSGPGLAAGQCGTITSPGGLYTAPGGAPASAVTVTATSVDDPLQSGSGAVTIATGPFISKLFPASITALPANGSSFTLKVQGINFAPSSPGPGSVILLTPTGTATKQLAANCTISECSATIAVADVGSANRPPHPAVQIQNPGNPVTNSNAVSLIVLDAATEQKDFASASVVTLSAGNPNQGCNTPPLPSDAGCQNITVVEPTTMGSTGAAGQVNFNLIGVFSGSSCLASGLSIAVVRPTPPSLPTSVSICVVGTANFSATDKFTISGPNPSDITVLVDPNQNFPSISVKLSLTIPFDARTGPRTLFVETANREKSAFVGAIEVK